MYTFMYSRILSGALEPNIHVFMENQVKMNSYKIYVNSCAGFIVLISLDVFKQLSDRLPKVTKPCCSTNFTYTGGIPQRFDTDVHSIVLAKTSTAL